MFAPQLLAPEAAALYDAADGRGWKYSSPVNGWAISREPTGLPSASSIRLPSALSRKTRLADGPAGRAGTATQQMQQRQDQQQQVGTKVTEHGSLSVARRCSRASDGITPGAAPTSTMSISLMPTNGTITPPRPQISRLRRSRASAPTGR